MNIRVRELNASLWRSLAVERIFLTASVEAISKESKAAIFDRVREAFGKEAENDLIRIECDGVCYIAKIEFFSRDLSGPSPDPSNPMQTVRVLTLMRADEY